MRRNRTTRLSVSPSMSANGTPVDRRRYMPGRSGDEALVVWNDGPCYTSQEIRMAGSDPKGYSRSAALTPQSSVPVPAPSSPPGASDRFMPGVVFADRYRMVTCLGQGGMGEVWQADDLVLGTPVAIKLLHSTDSDQRERLLREVRLARQVTHPGVCRVFDIGEADGAVFYSMEYIDGEDLATLVRRAGRLMPQRVVDFGRQLCAAVAAAHAQGVLHRDLKPANVLVDSDGAIRITDFGIAIARSEERSHTIVGTPGYMAPEQLAPGAPLSERTDVYAIGLILYELLVGHRPIVPDGDALPPPPSALVPGVASSLDHVVMKALAPKPRDRHASAAAMVALLQTDSIPAVRRRRTMLAWLAGIGLAAVVALIALLPSYFGRPGATGLTDQDTIVLADFANSTGEPVFDGTLKVALAVALEQSPFLKVFSDDNVRETLRLMERQPNVKVTREVAREIATRERLKALVAGSISPLGTHYAIALEAINAETGDVMAREQVEATSREQVLASLGQATTRLRERLGESLPSLRKFDMPLPRATTSSLEALHAYSLALDDGRLVMRKEAVPHLQRALELDPNFALAHALLSGVYANTDQAKEALPHAQRAFELRDRVSERERYFVSWRYYIDAQQAWGRALDLAAEWTRAYPRDAFAFNSLGLAAGTLGEHVRAEEAFREARRLDPRFVPPHRNLAGTLMWRGNYTGALQTIDEAREAGLNSLGMRQIEYYSAFVLNDTERQATAWRGLQRDDEMFETNALARIAVFNGQIMERSHQLHRQSADRARRSGLPQLAAGWLMEDAESHAIIGDCTNATQEWAEAIALSRDNFSLERASRLLAICGDVQTATGLTAELASRFADATLTTRLLVPITNAVLALRRNNPEQARAILQPVQAYDLAAAGELWPPYLRGTALLAMNDAAGAAEQFQFVIDHRGVAPASPLFALAHLGLAKAEVARGRREQARSASEQFLSLWKDASANAQQVAEARALLARLS